MKKYDAPLGHIVAAIIEIQKQMKLDSVTNAYMVFNGLEVPLSVNSNPRDISIIAGLMHDLRWFEMQTGRKAFDN